MIYKIAKYIFYFFCFSLTKFLYPCHDVVLDIEICFNTENCEIPKTWKNKIFPTPINDSDRSVILNTLEKIMKKYPHEFLKHHLRKIYVWEYFTLYNLPYSATNHKDIMYLTFDKKTYNKINALQKLEIDFHHELLHILFWKYYKIFNVKQWKSFNGSTKYLTKSGKIAIKINKISSKPDTSYFKKGFLCEYGSTCLPEDVATFSFIFLEDKMDMMNAVKNYPILNKKYNHIIEFYHKLSPFFTKEYFESIK